MTALFILIPISLGLAGAALVGFIWAVKKGQFNDLAAPADQIIFEDFQSRNLHAKQHEDL